MIFQYTWQQILGGQKTQTRRLAKDNEDMFDLFSALTVMRIDESNGKCWVKWQAGRTYAVQPGRNEKAVARIRLVDICQEQLQDITAEDALAEGIGPDLTDTDRIAAFAALWDRIHTKPGTRWDDNPEVWVLEFELAGGLSS